MSGSFKKLSLLPALLITTLSANAQLFYFPAVTTPPSCTDDYTLYTGFRVVGVQLTNIYYDNGTNGSFGFEMVLKYGNIFDGTVVSSGNFYTYKGTLYTSNPNISGPISNNASNVPLQTDTSGTVTLNNNPSYNGSASALGLTTGVLYTGQDTIDIFGFDSATLEINLPCIPDTILIGSPDNTYPLPVQLSGFIAAPSDEGIILSWQTFTEQNNAGFSIEKSPDGKSWSEQAFLPSKAENGNSKRLLKYSFRDIQPLNGNNFYRLTQTDMNGTRQVSGITKANFRSIEKAGMQVYPNPARDIVSVAGLKDANAAYIILDITGQTIQKGKLEKGKLKVQAIPNGVYFIKTQGKTQKITVLH